MDQEYEEQAANQPLAVRSQAQGDPYAMSPYSQQGGGNDIRGAIVNAQKDLIACANEVVAKEYRKLSAIRQLTKTVSHPDCPWPVIMVTWTD